MRSRVLTLLLALATVPGAARSADAPASLAPYEDLLEVVGVLTWHLRDDLYRFPSPTDPSGHDVFHLALDRLTHWEQRYPDRHRDVTTLAKARAYERLGAYGKALDAYTRVTTMESPLAATARATLPRARAFADAAALPEEAGDIDAHLRAIRTKLDAWSTLATEHAGTPYQAIARVEEERLERTAARLVVERRHFLSEGTAASERALRFLIEKHGESRHLAAYVLALGDLYADVTREYVAAIDGRPLAFDESEFVRRADRALETYRKVATWDGAPEKPEGEARYAGLEAFKTSVLGAHR